MKVKVKFRFRSVLACCVMTTALLAVATFCLLNYSFNNQWPWIIAILIAMTLLECFAKLTQNFNSKTSFTLSDIAMICALFVLNPLSIMFVIAVSVLITDRYVKVSFYYSYLNLLTIPFAFTIASILVNSPFETTSVISFFLCVATILIVDIADTFVFFLFGEYKEVKNIWISKYDYYSRAVSLTIGIPAGILARYQPWAITFIAIFFVFTLLLFNRNENTKRERDNLKMLVDTLDFSGEDLTHEDIGSRLITLAERLTNSSGISITNLAPIKKRLSVQFDFRTGKERWLNIDTLTADKRTWRHNDYLRNLKVVANIAKRAFENYELREQLKDAAEKDSLTGLYNRRTLEDILKLELASYRRNATPVTLLFLDLDKFKSVNDKHGHMVGDIVLKEAASRILSSVREEDVVARIGGDEFVVVCKNISKENLDIVLSRINDSISKDFKIPSIQGDDRKLRIGISIGIATSSPKANTADLLLNSADKAMYNSKKVAKNIDS